MAKVQIKFDSATPLAEYFQSWSHLILFCRELDNLTYFFNRNLDFYQYYRSHSTIYDEYYFIRGKANMHR